MKHLNHIEEQILESLAWKVESPLWDKIRENENKVPTCEEVTYMGSYHFKYVFYDSNFSSKPFSLGPKSDCKNDKQNENFSLN